MSGGGIEREREGAWEQGREGNFKGGSIFTNQPFTNRPLPLRLGAYAMAWTRCITGNPSGGNHGGRDNDREREGRMAERDREREGQDGGRLYYMTGIGRYCDVRE